LRTCGDPETRQTWKEFSHKKEQQQAQEIGSLQNKVAALADPLPLRYILGQPSSTLSMTDLLLRGDNLVVDLSDIGDEPAAILGAIIINAFKQAADETKNTKPYRLYIDEFQNFGTSIISTLLSESGKRELWLTLAHQFISQLDEEIRDAVLGNCSTKIAFRVGAEDAKLRTIPSL
jgi:type IV secretory pathway TraG/TraD family ATPase VirD4